MSNLLTNCYVPCCIIWVYKIFTMYIVEAHVPLLNMHKMILLIVGIYTLVILR